MEEIEGSAGVFGQLPPLPRHVGQQPLAVGRAVVAHALPLGVEHLLELPAPMHVIPAKAGIH